MLCLVFCFELVSFELIALTLDLAVFFFNIVDYSIQLPHSILQNGLLLFKVLVVRVDRILSLLYFLEAGFVSVRYFFNHHTSFTQESLVYFENAQEVNRSVHNVVPLFLRVLLCHILSVQVHLHNALQDLSIDFFILPSKLLLPFAHSLGFSLSLFYHLVVKTLDVALAQHQQFGTRQVVHKEDLRLVQQLFVLSDLLSEVRT